MPCSHCGNKKVLARGYCGPCYHRLRKRGTLQRANVVKQENCSHPGCTRKAFSKNLCQTHYNKADHPLKSTWKLLRSRWAGAYPAEWSQFSAFIADVGERPTPKHQLRRIDPSKPFARDNVFWLERVKGGRSKSMSPVDRAAYGREWAIRKKYKITGETYARLFEEQGGVCAICGTRQVGSLHIDHCHDSGKVRGLLCNNCNRGIGYLGDSVERLRRAVEYLSAG